MQQLLVKILLYPFSILYGLGVSIRNKLYDKGLLREVRFDVPVISVGNLSVGGAGKTPHIEYLITLLRQYINVATLSRGYKRKTAGYLQVQPQHRATDVGDEPLQYKRKYPETMVTVAESRSLGIPQLMMQRPDTQVILLDDAFQHRAVKPYQNILLTEYGHPFTDDILLPAGRLREQPEAYKRADVIVVSKCPPQLSEADRQQMLAKLQPYPHQQVFFSYYDYGHPYFMFNGYYRYPLIGDTDVLLVSAIANTEYMERYLGTKAKSIKALEYADHHFFDEYDLGDIKKQFDAIASDKKIIITTEKDAMRLERFYGYIQEHKLPIYLLPVKVNFHFDEKVAFDQYIKDKLMAFKV
ncbi:MAG: tetraacyldisaccharide 4'-kinase [Saprospiraceae bacterium]|nr:tetraacyldisaccharide 4'-kinase [Saprospiraceae bacterium]MBP7680021.1 tetraacyldisaccharide 4'-kinase [Saprospiraceae bacterium]